MSNIQTDNLNGKLFLIIGPSGVGKGTVIEFLRKKLPDLKFVLSATTREPRSGEKDGEIYHFISKNEFEKGIENGDFLEWAKVHGKNYYGILKGPVMESLRKGENVLREVDMQGLHSIKKIIPEENTVSVFLKPESMSDLKIRINRRGKLPEEEVQRRMESAKKEMSQMNSTDYQVFSREGGIDELNQEILSIFRKEMTK
ncbi:guanylate kinase [Candidatus Peregrinibacteria bacterium]|nr:guanylate kinase [Candidatus Peregrinibacteria bacterium]